MSSIRLYSYTRKSTSVAERKRLKNHRSSKAYRFRRSAARPVNLFDLGSKESMAYEPITDEEVTNEIKRYMKVKDDQYLEDSLGEI